MFNKEVDQFIRSNAHCQLVNTFSHEEQKLLYTIDTDTPYDLLFLYFWEPVDILYWYIDINILTWLDCMSGFRQGVSIRIK